ncbi:MAG: hypothetical protein JWN04_1965 [Myxococcaceae bacterium]|nr:hypothetical protein [Myxococcaceae bacterium]
MKYPFDPALSGNLTPRPFVPVRLEGLEFAVPALVDSGAVGNRFDATIGELAGLDLSLGCAEHVKIGGAMMFGHALDVSLTLGKHSWTAEICFLEGWQVGYQVLGLYGFFDHFNVRFRAASRELLVLP